MIHKEGHRQHKWHGGIVVLVHESIPSKEILLNTPLQAVAVQVKIGILITIVSVYNSRNHELGERLLSNLKNQLPLPVLITGDFNGYHPLWGSDTADSRGTQISNFIASNNLNILNNGNANRLSGTSRSAIDLSIVSPSLQPQSDWTVDESPLDSDHCPIEIKIQTGQHNPGNEIKMYNLKKASWTKFQSHSVWNRNVSLPNDLPTEQLVQHLYSTIKTAADDSIPITKIGKYYPKSWWSRELSDARDRKERFYKIYNETNKERHQ